MPLETHNENLFKLLAEARDEILEQAGKIQVLEYELEQHKNGQSLPDYMEQTTFSRPKNETADKIKDLLQANDYWGKYAT
jgi:hypothetical protein